LELSSKDDILSKVHTFYQHYHQPTLLFLGNLSKLSSLFQEGLLRLLEEPPANLYIVLFSHSLQEVLGTISSRCQVHLLASEWLWQHLDEQLLEKVKKKLPPAREVIQQLLKKHVPTIESKQLKTVEREELDFWLWQLQSYVTEFYQQKPNIKLADWLTHILRARQLNQENLQKRLVVDFLIQK
jgi:predicted house-cleaning noncanonical NTP pyrophosphatase (MazG superfamily)